jgi:hypothetical protein
VELEKTYKAMEKEVKKLGSEGHRKFDEKLKTMFWSILCLEWEMVRK